MKPFKKYTIVAMLGCILAAAFMQGAYAFGVKRIHKVSICHGTASEKNPYVLIHVDINALKGHFDGTAPGHGKKNHPDFLAGNGGCSTPPGGPPES